MGGSIRVNPQRQAELETQLAQIKQVRATLLAQYPVSGLIEAHQVSDDVSDAQIEDILTYRFAGINRDIDVSKEKISNGDIPLNELDALIPQILAETPEGQRAEVEQYLKKQQRIDTAIEVGGTLGEIGLTAGAIVTGILSGGIVPTILGGLGTALGIGNAVYQFERADDLNLIAKTGDAGGNQLLTQPNIAKTNYLLGWANLVLAGIDGGLAVKEGTSLLKGARTAEILADIKGAEVLSQLNPEQISQFDEALQLQDAGKFNEAQQTLDRLNKELDKDVFNKANFFFKQAFEADGIIPFGTHKLSSAAKIGDEASELSIKVGTVRMEDHPNYKSIIKEFEDSEYEVVVHSDFKSSPRVEVLEIVDKNTGEIRVEKRLHVTKNMRFTDLEHEYGHLQQLKKFGENTPPTQKEEIITGRNGQTVQRKAKNQQGVITTAQNAVLEYHNYLSEYLRLYQREASQEILEEHATYVRNWRNESNQKKLNITNSKLSKWTKKHLSDLSELIEQYEASGGLNFETGSTMDNYGS